MNKIILTGRLTRDPEVRYSQSAEPMAVVRYTLAVNRKFKREGEADADFINCVAFGKIGEFADKYFKKGMLVSVVGRLKISSWDDQNGQKRWNTDVIIEEQEFAESKASFETHRSANPTNTEMPKPATPVMNTPPTTEGFYPIDESIEDEDLPF